MDNHAESLKNAIQTACTVHIYGANVRLSDLLNPYETACYIAGLIICSLSNSKVHALDPDDLTGYKLITESDGMRITAQVAKYLYNFTDDTMAVYQFLGLLEMCYRDDFEKSSSGTSPNKTYLLHIREYVMPSITSKTTITDIIQSVPGKFAEDDMPWNFKILQLFDDCIKHADNLSDSKLYKLHNSDT